MKYLFLFVALALTLASILTARGLPDTSSDRPVIYWMTDKNPARIEQVEMFEKWLETHHPDVRVKLLLDTSNTDQSKRIIQGVSGVAGEIIDLWKGGTMRYFDDIGLLEPLNEDARRLHFDLSQTYPSLANELAIEDINGQLHQYQFPCNVIGFAYWVNRETFEKVGLPAPPDSWTVDEFEDWGRRFKAAANKPGQKKVFFADTIPAEPLRRSYGVDAFNETLTASTLDDPRAIEAWRKIYQWTYVDNFLPTGADRQSFAVEGGYGGEGPQLFYHGRYAMLRSGRYLVIQFRKFPNMMKLGVSATPYKEFPNTDLGTRAAAVYVGSPHKDLAKYFLSFLASEDYNMQIIRDGDGLPPNPEYTKREEYTKPAEYPDEWEPNRRWLELMDSSIGGSYSPFVLASVAAREENNAYDKFMNNQLTVEEAAATATRKVNDEIQRTLAEQPKLRPLYDQLVKDQAEIERLRARGQKVPLRLIRNPFHRQYYKFKGWAE